ncbi:hypothetical protein DEU56DRAFT_288641 [Suillus clintonianus]|uniref:uncharacterized protein n=1 Tax=Suillus clintonianus TaxID=1904413 RepID=UPI001B8737B4|nr:uncharacterized protein DEU56DRAFT_288641 [Suillus clintonianus]KAG2140665.1 hypothetical protein DEU56DRAFT_288641 [Suillus clintonianus]
MLQVLFKRDAMEAQIQRRYMENGQYDLCIDDSKQVTRLTSHEWPRIEEGTKIVMRVIIEQKTWGSPSEVDYQCQFCGAVNHLGVGSIIHSLERQAGCSIDCRECKRRFQISRDSTKFHTQSSNIANPRTDAEMLLIRNFHVQQSPVRDLAFSPGFLTLMVSRPCPALSGECVISSFDLLSQR